MQLTQPTVNHIFNETRKFMTFLGKEDLWKRSAPELLVYTDEEFKNYALGLGLDDFAMDNAAGGYDPKPHVIIFRDSTEHTEESLSITLFHEVVHSLQNREALIQRFNPCGPQFPKTESDVIDTLFDNEFEREAYVIGCILGMQSLEKAIAKVEKLLADGKINSKEEFIDYTWSVSNMKELLAQTYTASIN